MAEAAGFKCFAEETKLNRESPYKALSEDGNPTLESLSKMLDVLRLDIWYQINRSSQRTNSHVAAALSYANVK